MRIDTERGNLDRFFAALFATSLIVSAAVLAIYYLGGGDAPFLELP